MGFLVHNLSLIEECYQRFIKDLPFWVPEGIYFVNLELLHHFDLLHFQPIRTKSQDPIITRYFHVVESSEKITLINNEFVIWIITDRAENRSVTYTLIALNPEEQEPHLEVAFIASGIYNTSLLVLKVLEKFLLEIQETESLLTEIENK